MSQTNDPAVPTPSRCYPLKAPEKGPPLFQQGNIVFQAHYVGWIVSAFFATVATIASIWLVNKHLQWYTNKREQRYIIRLLLLVPIYAIVSFLSYLFWDHAIILILLRDCYESTVVTSFFYLLLMYLSPNPDEQKAILLKVGLSRTRTARQSRQSKSRRRRSRKTSPELQLDLDEGGRSIPHRRELDVSSKNEISEKAVPDPPPVTKWIFPLGWVRWKPKDGLHFFWLMKWGVLQYCVLRPLTTFVAVILEYNGLYCQASWSPRWGYVYVITIVSISVSIAMYCLIQLYVPIAPYLERHRPLLKLFAVKAVVFLTFWQATFLSVLSMVGVVKDTRYMTADEINIGFGALLETFEMMIFAFVHIKAFSYKPYRPPAFTSFSRHQHTHHNSHNHRRSKHPPPPPQPQRTPRLKSLGHAMDFRETWREIVAGTLWIWDWAHGRERRVDRGVWREVHLGEALGRSRPSRMQGDEVEVEGLPPVEDDGEQAAPDGDGWLGRRRIGYAKVDTRAYPFLSLELAHERRREKSEALEVQIERELERRGYGLAPPTRDTRDDPPAGPAHRPQKSWWRSMYDRFSQTGNDPEPDPEDVQQSQYPSAAGARRSSRSRHGRQPQRHRGDDPLPLGVEREDFSYEDSPPTSVIQSYRNSRHTRQAPRSPTSDNEGGRQQPHHSPRQHQHQRSDTDVVAPLSVYDQYQQQQMRGGQRQTKIAVLRSDSLLGRVFPQGTASSENENESVLSGSDTPVSPTRDARPLPPVPVPDISRVLVLGHRNGYHEELNESDVRSVSLLVHDSEDVDEPPPPPTPSHRRESAHFRQPIASPPLPRVDVHPSEVMNVYMEEAPGIPVDEPFTAPPVEDDAPLSRPSVHRRESAQTQGELMPSGGSPTTEDPENLIAGLPNATRGPENLPGSLDILPRGPSQRRSDADTDHTAHAQEASPARLRRSSGLISTSYVPPSRRYQPRSTTLPIAPLATDTNSRGAPPSRHSPAPLAPLSRKGQARSPPVPVPTIHAGPNVVPTSRHSVPLPRGDQPRSPPFPRAIPVQLPSPLVPPLWREPQSAMRPVGVVNTDTRAAHAPPLIRPSRRLSTPSSIGAPNMQIPLTGPNPPRSLPQHHRQQQRPRHSIDVGEFGMRTPANGEYRARRVPVPVLPTLLDPTSMPSLLRDGDGSRYRTAEILRPSPHQSQSRQWSVR